MVSESLFFFNGGSPLGPLIPEPPVCEPFGLIDHRKALAGNRASKLFWDFLLVLLFGAPKG